MILLFPAERLNKQQLGNRRHYSAIITSFLPNNSRQFMHSTQTIVSLSFSVFTMLPHNYTVCTVVPNWISQTKESFPYVTALIQLAAALFILHFHYLLDFISHHSNNVLSTLLPDYKKHFPDAMGIEPATYVLNHNISVVLPYFIEPVTAETDL